MNYTELHLHTQYSLLDGLNTAEEYLARAKELGMTHMAVTDHGTLAGHRDFQREAEKAGIVPILGVEAYISGTDRFDRRTKAKRDDNTQVFNHIGILALNENGMKNLNKLSELAWTEGFYTKPRMDMEILEEYSDDIVVLSGCMNGLVAKAIENELPVRANQLMSEFKRIFGDRFFVEIQGHNPAYLNEGLMDLAKRHGVLPVVTSDCHYARKEDLWKEEAMLILSTGPKHLKGFDFSKSQKMDFLERFNYLYPDRTMTFEEIEIYLRSAVEQKELLAAQGIDDQPVLNTMEVANMVGQVPYYEALDLLPQPKGTDPNALLEKKAWAGMRKRGLKGDKQYEDRLKEELEIIKEKDFAPYFLIVANAVQWAKSKGIMVGPGRGSGAGSLLNYCLEITNVDPIEHNLLFFRFINPERNDWPDIDVDFGDRRRHEVKDYMRRQYKHAASIATFGQWKGKRAVRDASRVFLVPLGEVNRALKGADWLEPIDWWAEWERTDRAKEFIKKYPEVIKLAKFLHGRVREVGMHAGGIVVSKEPIERYAPMQSAADPNDKSAPRIPVVAVDMEEAAAIGFIKQDFLGLKALSVVEDTLDLIHKRHGVAIDLEEMTYDDPMVYQTLSEGYTKGVFQCEQAPYTGLLIKMGGVKNFGELVASNALVRPGAANSTAGKDFIDRKEGRKAVEYVHELMKPFTKETYGTVIYQEQVMQTMTELAGMPMATADKVRKIIGKKKDVREFEQYKAEFIQGASKHVAPAYAEQLWLDFEAHAGYSFNKSHAVAYSMLSYWTAWLKLKYPIEFMCAVLRNEKDKDAKLDYLIETKRLGIRVKLPHINESDIRFSIGKDDDGEYVRFGLADIKFISDTVGRRLVEARPFKSYQELFDKVNEPKNGLSATCLKGMNAVGAAYFPDNPRTGKERDNYYEYLSIPAFEGHKLPPKIYTQLTTLDEYSETGAFVCSGMVRKIKTGDGWARVEMVDETGSAAAFTGEHTPIETGQMYVFLISNNRIARYISVKALLEGGGEAFREFLEATSYPDVPDEMLKVISFKTRDTKAGKKMADVIFAKNTKELIPAMVWPKMWAEGYTKLKEGMVVDVNLAETEDGTRFVERIL